VRQSSSIGVLHLFPDRLPHVRGGRILGVLTDHIDKRRVEYKLLPLTSTGPYDRSRRPLWDSEFLEGLHKLADRLLRVAVEHLRVVSVEQVVLDPCKALSLPAL